MAVLTSHIEEYEPELTGEELVKAAMASPIGSHRLCELAKGKKKIVIIASDHTRPVPSKVIIPSMLAEIREGSPDADITILIATGCHRGTTKDELVSKFGPEIVANEKIYIHDCDERDITKTMDIFLKRGRGETVPDQCQTQIFLRILMHARVIFVSQMPDDIIREMHMIPAHSIADAVAMARQLLHQEEIKFAAIPDGVSVMVAKDT